MMLLSSAMAVASLLSVTSAVAIPSNCLATYDVQQGDSCTGIAAKFNNFTTPALYQWNRPDINVFCSNLPAGQPVCINVQPYTYTPIQAGAIWSKSQTPVPQLPNVVSSCKFFVYTTLGGSPGLSKILSDNGITREDWVSWNGQSNVWGGYFSCVSA